MKKQFFLLTLIASMASSMAHGSMLQKLRLSATAALKRMQINTRVTRNTSTASCKAGYDPIQDFSRGPRFVAKEAARGIAGGVVGGTIVYYGTYGLVCGEKRINNEIARDMGIVVGALGASAGSSFAGGLTGLAAFAASVMAVGCAKSAKIKFDEHKTAQAKEAK